MTPAELAAKVNLRAQGTIDQSAEDEIRDDIESQIREHGEDCRPKWLPIESAPKDGRHILVGDFTKGRERFFGWYDGRAHPWQDVVHYWSRPSEEGFYMSNGDQERPVMNATHWMPLPDPPKEQS